MTTVHEYTPHDPFDSVDWLDSSTSFDPLQEQSFDHAINGIFAQEPQHPVGNGYAGYREQQEQTSTAQGATFEDLTSGDSGAGLMAGASQMGTNPFYQDGQSPPNSSAYSYAPSSAGDTSFTSLNSSVTPSNDLDFSLLSSASFPSQPSPAFSFGTVEDLAANLPVSFDTNALQSLFADTSSLNGSSNSPSIGSDHLSPFSYPVQQPHQTISPASTTSTSPYSPPQHAFPPALSPAQLFSSTTSTFPSPLSSIPRFSVDSTASMNAAVPPPPPLTFGAFQAQQAASGQRSLAATAGIAVPPHLLQPNLVPTGLSGPRRPSQSHIVDNPASSAHIPLPLPQSNLGLGVALPGTQALPPLPLPMQAQPQSRMVGQEQTRKSARRQSPVEVIANAGLSGRGVYQAPLLQLHPQAAVALQQAAAPATTGTGANGRDGSTAVGQDGKGATAAKGKKAVKAKDDRGHNAVEQKYRNSINNALATLRDMIPALRHLKPLPSMPATKRKASQFTLATSAIPETPTGLIDGVAAAKTLSKGTILNKSIEYIDFLRSTRDGQTEDIELLKGMVLEMVGGAEGLIEEFERRRQVNEVRREEERRIARESEGDGVEDEGDEEEEDDEEVKLTPAAKGRKAAASSAAPKKRGKKDDSISAPAKKTRLGSQQIPLISDYQHVQALNAAHLEALASQHQQSPHYAHQPGFPPSPVSSGEGVSPSALHNSMNGPSPPRVLLASFMGLSFAGGVSYDWTTATAAEEAAGTVARAWTSRLVRRSASSEQAAARVGGVVDLLHPSLLSGLVALGFASIVVAFAWLLFPLFSRRSSASSAPAHASRQGRRRVEALSSLAALNSITSKDQTCGEACTSALQARRELLKLVGAPSAVTMLASLVREAVIFALREVIGLSFAVGGAGRPAEESETATGWIRVAEIEASLGERIPYIFRIYTFLRLSNLTHSSSWPHSAPSPSTSPSAVTALLAIHLLALGHAHWAENLWKRMLASHKKSEPTSPVTESFVDLALALDFTTVTTLLGPSTRSQKALDAPASPSDTVPLLVLAEATCEDALQDVWEKLFVGVASSTTGSSTSAQTSAFHCADLGETLDNILSTTVDGSVVYALAALSKVFLTCFIAGTSASPSPAASRDSTRALFTRLTLEYRQSPSSSPFSRLAASRPFLQLFLPVFAPSLSLALPSLQDGTAREPVNDVDLLATTVLEWLVVRKAGAAALVDRSTPELEDSNEDVKVDAALHARALAVRRLLGNKVFSSASSACQDAVYESEEEWEQQRQMEDAKGALVDALTRVARRAAGLKGGLWDEEDSGVELE
ncbi:hypothetical protein JCM11641_001874 [Rhodosporidiobolus odoratus]